MLVVATHVLVLFLAMRLIESAGRFLISWFRTRSAHQKVQYQYKRIVAIVTPELHSKIKAHVTSLNTTITEYILTAVTEKLKRETHG
jgi:hypothetical protein